MWADHTRSSSSSISHRIELHAGRARLTPDRDYSPPKSRNCFGSCGIEVFDLAELGVHGAEQGVRLRVHHLLTEDCAANFRRCSASRTPVTAAPEPYLAKAAHRPHPQQPGEHRRGRATTFGGWSPPARIIVPRTALTHGSPETDCGTVHTSGDNPAHHRDDHQAPGQLAPRDNSGARAGRETAGAHPDQLASAPYVAAVSQYQIDNRDRTRRAPSLGPIRRHRAAPTAPPSASMAFRPPTSMSANSFAPVPALAIQPRRDDPVGHDVGPGFGGSARTPTTCAPSARRPGRAR